MNMDQVSVLARKLIVAAGGVLVSRGYFSQSTWTEITGYAAIILPILWSLLQQMEGPKLEAAIDLVNKALATGDASHSKTVEGTPTVVNNTVHVLFSE